MPANHLPYQDMHTNLLPCRCPEAGTKPDPQHPKNPTTANMTGTPRFVYRFTIARVYNGGINRGTQRNEETKPVHI